MMNDAEFFASEWGMSMMMDASNNDNGAEDLSRCSRFQEPSNDFVLGSWQVEQDPSTGTLSDDDEDDFMAVDNIVDETPLTPPAGRLSLEEALEDTLVARNDDDEESFFTTHSFETAPSPPVNLTTYLPIEQRYQATLDKLAESMKKSQETRKFLRIKTTETMEYNRWGSISGTLASIEKSTKELQQYLKTKQPTQIL